MTVWRVCGSDDWFAWYQPNQATPPMCFHCRLHRLHVWLQFWQGKYQLWRSLHHSYSDYICRLHCYMPWIKLISFRNVTKPLQMNVVTFYRSSVSLFGYVLNIASVTGTKAFIFKLPYKHHFGSLLIPLTVITHPGKVDWVCLLVFSSELHIHWGHPI